MFRSPQNPPDVKVAPPKVSMPARCYTMQSQLPKMPKVPSKKAPKQAQYETPAADPNRRLSKRQAAEPEWSPLEFTVGSRVGVHWGGGDYYAATIVNASHDGQKQVYDVEYDDPDESGTLTTGVTLGKMK